MATYGSPPVRRSYPVAASDNDRYDEYWPRNTEAVHQCKYAKPVSSASAVFPRNSSGSSPNGWMLYHPQIEMSSSMQVSKMRSEPFFDGTSGSPSAFARKSHQAEHDPCKSAAQSQSMPISRIRNVQVRFPGRAPIAPQQSALKPLLSPIRLSSQTVQVDCGMTGSDSALPILSRSQSDEKIQNEIPSLRIANGRQHDGHVLQRKLHQGSQSKHTIEGNNHVTLSMSPPLEGYELRSPGCEIFSTPMRRTSGQKIQRSIGSRYLRDVADMVDNDGQLETQNSWKSTVSDENSTPTPSKVHIKDGFSCCNEPELRINTMNFEKDAGKAVIITFSIISPLFPPYDY